MDVFRQRLEDEYNANVIVTAPTVPYQGMSLRAIRLHVTYDASPVVYRDRTVLVSNPTDFPDTVDSGSRVREVQEPVVKASIILPQGQLSPRSVFH